MYTNTLAGVFPEPKPPQRRNFVKENVKQIKRLQGLIQQMSAEGRPQVSKDKFQTAPKSVVRRTIPAKLHKNYQKVPIHPMPAKKVSDRNVRKVKKQICQKMNTEIKLNDDANTKYQEPEISSFRRNDRFVTRGIQTEKTDNIEKFLETGVIKYPSDKITKQISKNFSPRSHPERKFEGGDAPANSPGICRIFDTSNDDLNEKMDSLNLNEKHDFIKENILALKQKAVKKDSIYGSGQPPPSYQKGHIPKYLKDRKVEQIKEMEKLDIDCPEGHVLLPDEERRETLRVLRQSYADRIQELNSMPVRNDTLRMKKRKMEIEEELKKIDEGIKVFQRPKVYVKINA